MRFYFAWAGPDTAFGPEHEVEDEDAFNPVLTHEEGDFPSLAIDIINPRVGLLNPGRDLWAWWSYDDGSTDGVTPLFYGRLVGIPDQIEENVVRLNFTARPSDYDEQKEAVAAAMRVLPYYDPVWIAEDRRDDPDAVLEGYAKLWHVDRVTHVVTASDIITGEDGTLDLTDDFFYASLDTTIGAPPARRIRCEAQVMWEQKATGSVNFNNSLFAAFAAAGTSRSNCISTYTGEGLMRDWPVEGKKIGAGWEVGTSSVRRTDGFVLPQEYTQVLTAIDVWDFPIWHIRPTFNINYDVTRAYTEKVVFELEADVQAVVTEPGDEEVLLLTLASNDIEQPIDAADTDNPDGTLPIGDVRRRSYFQIDRGRDSLECLIALCRAQLLARARTVGISFAMPFASGLALSCRKNVSIDDPRLPGGTAAGKITGYSLSVDGDSGAMECRVTIGCTIGQGNTVTASAGTPDYVAEGYVETGWQTYSGSVVMPVAGEVTYDDFSDVPPNDDGVDFFDMREADNLVQMVVINGVTVQRNLLEAFYQDVQAAVNAVNAAYTEVDMDLRVLTGGPFETEYTVTVSDLMVPKTIDLEAA